jgi:O-antigen/teichoic acid export membrane protein
VLTLLTDGVRDIKLFLQRRPFDRTSADERARERHIRMFLGAGASLLAKVISIITALISVPLTLHYLGPERYGMWMTMSSLVAIFSFADLGIGNGVLSAVAGAHGRDDRGSMQGIVSSGFFALLGVAVTLIIAFVSIYPFVSWHKFFNVETIQARNEAGPALGVFICCFALAIPIGIVQRVQMGLQRAFMASLWQCASSVLSLIALLAAIRTEASLPWLVLAFAGTPLIAALGNSILFFGWLEPDLAPNPRAVSRAMALRVANTGLLFFVLQIISGVLYASDSVVIAQMLGASAVTGYAVPLSLFNLVNVLIAMALTPLWPAYGEAIARGDNAWVRRIFVRSLIAAVGVASAASIFLLVVGQKLIALWVGHAVEVPFLLLLGLACWKVIEAGGNAVATFLNGAHIISPQVAIGAVTAIVGIVLKIALVKALGVPGVVWATIVAYTICAIVPFIFIVQKVYANVLLPNEGTT